MAENQKMEIDLGEDVAQGNYINLAIIAHSVSEFIIDFATVLPGVPKAKVKSRVILTPEHAKRLLLSLQENITRYESNGLKSGISGRLVRDGRLFCRSRETREGRPGRGGRRRDSFCSWVGSAGHD